MEYDSLKTLLFKGKNFWREENFGDPIWRNLADVKKLNLVGIYFGGWRKEFAGRN